MSTAATKRLRHLFECCDSKRIPLNGEQRSSRPGEIPYWGANSVVGFVNQALFDEELVLLGEDGAPFLERDRPKAFHSTGAIWPNNHVHVLRPRLELVDARFMAYALNAVDYAPFIDGSTRDKLTQAAMNDIPLPCPRRQQQTVIANFLDEQTARIDALIAEKEALRAAVKEYFIARLGTAVVEGLGSRGELVSADARGYERVRADWKLVPLKYLVSFSGGMTPSKDNDLYWTGDIPWVSPKDMKRFVLSDSEDHVSQLALDTSSLKLQPPGSVLVVVRGMILAHTFPVAISVVDVTINQDMKAMRPKSAQISAGYLAWMLRGLQPLMLSLTEESAHGTKVLRTDQWANQAMPVPSSEEQAALVTQFERWESETTQLLSHLTEHIDRLREYRSSLISAAVMGQLDIGAHDRRPQRLAA